MKIAIIGLGYVGLPLALQAASKGHEVIGVDKNIEIVQKINKGESHIHDPFIEKLLSKVRIKAQTEPESADIYVVCVPTPINNKKLPDLKFIEQACKELCSVLQDGQLVVIESTIYPGVCEEVVKPLLDKCGVSYSLAHCPERINPGDRKWNISNIPRVLGGIDEESTNKAKKFYDSILDAEVTTISQIKAAEATKILENTFRDINIAFVNEMAKSFYKMGIDIQEVIKGASSKPFAFIPHYPGAGVGGHCIAVDPYYMIEKAKNFDFDHEFLKLARKINSGMPFYTADLVSEGVKEANIKSAKVGVYGIAYKPNVSDDRESPAYDLIKGLKKNFSNIEMFDPFVKEKSTANDLNSFLGKINCLVICTEHDEIKNLDLSLLRKNSIKLVVDGRNCLDKEKIKSLGISYVGIGRN